MGSSGNLKRPREEDHGASQGRHPWPPLPPAVTPPTRLGFADAAQFVLAVKRGFADEPGKFEEFLAVMRGFRLGSYGFDGITNRLQVLFHGHPDLIRSFNVFLPRGYQLCIFF